MSKAAVDALLREWDTSANPLFHAAAGQMRRAMREPASNAVVCSHCGRVGTRGFSLAVDGLGDYLCENVEACDRRWAAAVG